MDNDSKTKIAMIGLKGLPAYGGAASVGENIIEHLNKRYNFTVYSSAAYTDLRSGYYDGYKHIVFRQFLPRRLNLIYYFIISTIHCFFSNYDGIHMHHNMTGIFTRVLSIRYKTIYTSHNTRLRNINQKYSFLIKYSEQLAVQYSSAVTAVSKTTYHKYLKKRYSDVYYIPNGVNNINLDKYEEAEEDYILFGAARVIPSKGCHILLKAAENINRLGEIKIAGDINYSVEYKEKLLKLSNNLKVEFLGLIKNRKTLFQYIRNAKLFIFPSTIEAMSMMLLEVASLKTPIICSDIKENKDLFNKNEVLYFNSGDHVDLANKIEFALMNMDIMKQKSELAYRKVTTKYLWSEISEEYSNLYELYFS